ncbi:MAG: hypothetical protein ABSE49_01580 [Polyangiaceae bacterium]|jgi:hypothetical protein
MRRVSPIAASLLVLLLACSKGASGEAADAAPDDDSDADAGSAGDDAPTSTVTIETPADSAPPADGAAVLPAACAEYDGGVPAYASPAGGTVDGPGVSATLCTAVDIDVSAYLSPSNRLLLRVAAPVSTVFESPAGATLGTLAMMVSVGTDTPALYTSAESQSCGFVAFTYDLPEAPGEVTYLASATSDCVDATMVSGAWAVTLTSVARYAGDAGSPGTYYVAHGTFTATLPQSNGGPGMVTVSLAF